MNHLVADDATLTNIRRLFVVTLAALPLHLAHVALFGLATPARTGAEIAWRQGILLTHAAGAAFMAAACLVLLFLRRRPTASPAMRFIIVAFLLWLPAMGILLVAYDQYVTTNITPFLVVCMAVGFLPLLRPVIALTTFGVSYLIFHFAIALFQGNDAILLTNRVNGLTFAAIGFVLSVILWLQFRRNILQHRQIVDQSRELRERNLIIERELDLARLIQQKLIPAAPPQVPGFNIAAAVLSMDKVGGDFYDVTPGENGIGVFLGDASGHGIPAAFLASVAKTAYDFSGWTTESPAHVLKAMDRVITNRSVQAMFVTAVFARIESSRLAGATAGHWPPLIFRPQADSFIHVAGRGRPLGFGGEKPYQDFSADLMRDDRLIFFTDGIIETRNPAGELFGEERLVEMIRRGAHLSVSQLLERVFETTHDFAGKAGLSDDATLVIVDIAA